MSSCSAQEPVDPVHIRKLTQSDDVILKSNGLTLTDVQERCNILAPSLQPVNSRILTLVKTKFHVVYRKSTRAYVKISTSSFTNQIKAPDDFAEERSTLPRYPSKHNHYCHNQWAGSLVDFLFSRKQIRTLSNVLEKSVSTWQPSPLSKIFIKT
jgi:hypothetical protein